MILTALVSSFVLLPALSRATSAPGDRMTYAATSSCSGYTSNTVPPNTIRVLATDPSNPTGPKTVQVIGFETYVENVLPNEWIPTWNAEALKAGAMAAKSYAWYWVIHWRGGTSNGQCYDVDDTTNYQVYKANSAQASTTAAVQATWYIDMLENGQIFEASYCSNMNCGFYPGAPTSGQDGCGTDPSGSPNTTGLRMSQYGSQACAQQGLDFRQILGVYYYVPATSTSPRVAPAFVTTSPPLPTLAAFQADNGDLWTIGTAGWKDWGVGMQPGTSPATTAVPNGYEMAFQAYGGQLWTVGNAGWTAWGLGMAPGTSPSIMALPKGFEVAFQSYSGHLWTVGNAGWKDWGVGMAPGTSPVMIALPNGGYEIAFQAYGGHLWTVGTAGWTDWGVGMAAGTSPAAIAFPQGGFEVGFQAHGGHLWTVGNAGWTDWGLGMAAGSGPSLTVLPKGGFEVALQAYGGQLWTVGNNGTTNWGLAMAPGTSPAISVQPNGSLLEGYEGSNGTLWTVGSGGYDWQLGMAPSTSPTVR